MAQLNFNNLMFLKRLILRNKLLTIEYKLIDTRGEVYRGMGDIGDKD